MYLIYGISIQYTQYLVGICFALIISSQLALMHSRFYVTVMSESFKARDIGLRAQKKILGRMAANKSARKIFIDDNTASLLDNLFKMIRLYVSNQSLLLAVAYTGEGEGGRLVRWPGLFNPLKIKQTIEKIPYLA